MLPPRFDLSVILPFGDDEEVIGTALRTLVTALRAGSFSFEVIAVDEDSVDNSHAVLAMLRPEMPELRVTHAPTRARGVETGAARAQGRVIAVIPPAAVGHLDGMIDAIDRAGEGAIDIEIALGRYLVAHRVRTLDAFVGARLGGLPLQRRFARRSAARGLRVVLDGAAVERPARPPSWRDAFATRRAS
jgi:hypothetical protein